MNSNTLTLSLDVNYTLVARHSWPDGRTCEHRREDTIPEHFAREELQKAQQELLDDVYRHHEKDE
jgi:hypothetical protein